MPYVYHPAPKMRKPRVAVDDAPAVQEFTPDPGEKKPRRRKVPEPPAEFEYEEPPEPKPKRVRKKPEPPEQPPEEVAVLPKPKRVRKKPEPGTVPPKEISFNSARGPINFTAHKAYEAPYQEPMYQPRSRYEHLHGNRWTELLNQW